MKEKYFVLLPDGIGLRNFAYTSFYNIAQKTNYEVIFWNNTPFNLEGMGYKEIKTPLPKSHKLTEIYKNTRKNIELDLNIKKTKDIVYSSYKFPRKWHTVNAIIKNLLTSFHTKTNRSDVGLKKVRKKIIKLEKKTSYYNQCLKALKKEKPSVVFCTSQRSSATIAPIEAAKSLGIPTVCFIFSWDNLPKATMVVETDYYFVWSKHMKSELLFYYPDIKDKQIIVTGTPQFEGHFNKELIVTKDVFYEEYGLDKNKTYICFSGDDITTSPNDQYYLEDTAKAVKKLNSEGLNIGIIFRRCPVDFSDRYDFVINEYQDIIVPIAPKWEQSGSMWNAIMPTKEDTKLLVNTAEHTELVINVGSSMVFDYICHEKPCAFINYDTEKRDHPTWNITQIYKYIHFKSMPDKKAVYWLNNKDVIRDVIENTISGDNKEVLEAANNWFDVIVNHPKDASKKVMEELQKIAK